MAVLTQRILGGRLLVGALLLLVISARLSAQLSPGDLHQTHAFLEGMSNCGKCHGSKQEILADNCLACHASIKTSLVGKTGLHGRNDYVECNLCHVEHHGRDFELIFWKGGREQFDHSETGYALEGKHKALDCRKCHNPKNILSPESLLAERRTLTQTYLGLNANCSSCHFDEHRGQVGANCQSCHSVAGWKPLVGFDHNRTKFVLSGKHQALACEKCHKPRRDISNATDTAFAQLTGIAHQACTDCHRDSHQGKFGVNCTGCHTTESWKSSNRANFDHSRTKFPLLGQHATLVCEKCHKPGQPFAGLKFDKCRACHEDYHRGEFASRQSAGACEECHDVQGFRPAKFSLEQHQTSRYPLQGAHLAVPCDGCHRKGAASARFQFAFEKRDCQSCHGDPHKGSQKSIAGGGANCDGCHNVESWSLVAFDHNRTKFPLLGKHTQTACRECHTAKSAKFDPAAMKFALTNFTCVACHIDTHRGQFASVSDKSSTDCGRCHFSTRWSELKFDHNRDSAYKLESAHTRVPCRGCHKQESIDSILVVRYKPIGTDCRNCHDTELYQNRSRP